MANGIETLPITTFDDNNNGSRASSPISSVTSESPPKPETWALPSRVPTPPRSIREDCGSKDSQDGGSKPSWFSCPDADLAVSTYGQRWSSRKTIPTQRFCQGSEPKPQLHRRRKPLHKKQSIDFDTPTENDVVKQHSPESDGYTKVANFKRKRKRKSGGSDDVHTTKMRKRKKPSLKPRAPRPSEIAKRNAPARLKTKNDRESIKPIPDDEHNIDTSTDYFEKDGEFQDIGDYFALRDVSRRIMTKTDIVDKPLPRGEPRVWADGRQALCETVLYYQSWQGACYINKGVLMSFMFDNNGHERDLIDEDVIIARAGGGMARDKTTLEMVQCRDQKENSQTDAVRTAVALQSPIVIFCGNQNSDIISQMPHRYNSLAWYKATHVWSEVNYTRTGGSYEQIKYRFEKLSASQSSWWMPYGPANAPQVGYLGPPMQHKCNSCEQTCQKLYLEGWMCLNTNCALFWTTPGMTSRFQGSLTYDPRFLKQRTDWACESPPYDMRPALPTPADRMGEDVAYAMTRGMCCPKCGKCTSRYLWRGWVCSCGFEHAPEHIVIPPASIRDPYHPVSRGFAQSTDWADRARITTKVEYTHNYRIMHYELDGIEGRITHMLANQTVAEESKGPDEMFTSLQTMDLDLERRRFSGGREEYMTAFSSNHGMPYKFVASFDSNSFTGSPWPLTAARSRMNWAAKTVLKGLVDDAHDFNELLTIGYFDGQNIKYHDDGETGLGPTVATLSLGVPADMLFRVKAKHNTGVSKSGVLIETPPLPGTIQCEARQTALDELKTKTFPTHAAKIEWLHKTAKAMGLNQNNGDRKPWMRLRLSHGDIVIMHGRAIQEYMEVRNTR